MELSFETINLIKSRNKGWNKIHCYKFIEKWLSRLKGQKPDGIGPNEYYVLPGFEDVDHNQPIIKFNGAEGMYEFKLNNKF